jgi:hypothetical protein
MTHDRSDAELAPGRSGGGRRQGLVSAPELVNRLSREKPPELRRGHIGQCKWDNGFNLWLFTNDSKGRMTTAVFFNLEPVDDNDKNTLQDAYNKGLVPVTMLLRTYPNGGTPDEQEAANAKLGEARKKEVGDYKDYVQSHAKMFVLSDGTGKGKDLIPDKGFYNALIYQWTRTDNAVTVYRLQAPAEATGDAKWVEYKKIKGNGDLNP